MSIKNLYPKARPRSIYNVINGRPELPAASTFSRASEGTYVDANGIIRTAAIDEPRFNYDPVTGEFLGLMLDKERENFSKWNEDPTQISEWSATTTVVTLNAGIAPDGNNSAAEVGNPSATGSAVIRQIRSGLSGGEFHTQSSFIKYNGGDFVYAFLWLADNGGKGYVLQVNLLTGEVQTTRQSGQDQFDNFTYKIVPYPNNWYRVIMTARLLSGSSKIINYRCYFSNNPYTDGDFGTQPPTVLGSGLYFGLQLELGKEATSYIKTEATTVTTEADTFSLTSSSNFDGGFSLLLDSETTTEDFIYKIKASGIPIAELNNANGTLDWDINGQSAAINGEYPQVGAIQPGRVRTVSSFGAADNTTQVNYLYTQGLSFPTNAIVAPGADEVEFGPGQTLKAAYLWNGQLSNTEAVSVIKGEYNIVPNEPIKADSYSFVYNTDPSNTGEASITLPYIVPTVSMRVYWGDGTNDAYEQGVTPSHTYPYPGQYRIQIEADDGFDQARLGGSLYPNVITRLDQWPPQFRVDATGPGFTGDQFYYILNNQKALGGTIPTFKYQDLTTLGAAFANCTGEVTPINLSPWEYIPTNIPLVTSVSSAFSALGRYNNEASPNRVDFPTLTTGPALTNVSNCFTNTEIPNFVNDRPFTDTSNCTNFGNAFAGCSLTNCIIDTSSGTNLAGLFSRNSFVTSPSIDTSSATDFASIMADNSYLTTQLAWNTSSVTIFSDAWNGCSSLTSFPQIDTSSGTNFQNAWDGCSLLTTFPPLNFDSATRLDGAWQSTGLTAFPGLDFPLATHVSSAWRTCTSLASFPANTTFPVCTSFPNAWRGCSGLTSFPALDLSSGTVFNYTWRGCSGLTSFPKLDFPNAIAFTSAWQGMTQLATFPADNSQDMFNTTGVLGATSFKETWTDCALTAQSIENILVSLDTNGQSNIELGIDGGTNAGQSTWTAAANTAYTNLVNKGWTITFNA